MKKLLKNVLVFSLLAAMCVALAGCGNKDSKKSSNNIVASRYFENGNYNETIEAVFDDEGNATKFIITMVPDDASELEGMKTIVDTIIDDEESTVEVKDDRIVIEMSAEEFLKEEGLSYDYDKISKDQVKELFERNEFTIKE